MGIRLGGRYELQRILGTGGTATVWLAQDEFLDRLVAIKILKEPMASDPEARARFQAEAKIAASLEADGIVPVYDRGEDMYEGSVAPFIVMKHLEGGDLATRIRTRPPNLEGALKISRELLAGLAVIHSRGLRHGDIKPGNVMFDADDSATIVDFGISRVIGETLDEESLAIGTARYVSPEQVERILQKGEGGAPEVWTGLDARSDVYSAGVLIFEVLTGRPPFDGRTRSESLRQHLYAQPSNPCALRPETPPSIGLLVLRAISRPPAGRYANAGEMLRALEDTAVAPRSVPILPYGSLPPDSTPTELLLTPGEDWFPVRALANSPDSGARIGPGTPPVGAAPPAIESLMGRWNRFGVAPSRSSRLDQLQVGQWSEQWLAALMSGCKPAQGLYWRIPDRLAVCLPAGEPEPAAGWDVLIRTVDKLAARRLRETLLGSDSGLDVTLPGLTVRLESVPGIAEVQMAAWSSGESPRTGVGDELLTLEIDAHLRLALEMRVEVLHGDTWRRYGAEPLQERMTFGTALTSTVFYDGPGSHRISPTAITVAFVDGPTARLRVSNAGGITFHDMPDKPLARRFRVRLWKRQIRAGELVTISSGDRIFFPHTSDAVRLEFE